jgi:hypothetical protein
MRHSRHFLRREPSPLEVRDLYWGGLAFITSSRGTLLFWQNALPLVIIVLRHSVLTFAKSVVHERRSAKEVTGFCHQVEKGIVLPPYSFPAWYQTIPYDIPSDGASGEDDSKPKLHALSFRAQLYCFTAFLSHAAMALRP